MYSRDDLQRVTCLDCARLGGCSEAYRLAKNQGPQALLDYICHQRWKPCSPAATAARWYKLESLGLLALRGMIESQTNTEDNVTRPEREQELQALNRMDLRKAAMQAGYPHKESLKAKSEAMITFILEKEFPADEKPPPKKTTTKKKTTKKKAAAKPAPAPEPPAGDPLAALGEVLDSHAATLDSLVANQETIIANQLKLGALLQNLGYGIMEPEDWDALVADAFPELADSGEGE